MFDKYVQYWNDTSLITAIDFKTGDIPANVAAAAYNDIIKAQLPDPVEEKPIIALDKLYENQADVYAVEASGNDGNVEMNAVDGDMSTRWSAYGPNTLTLDLKNEIEISGVAVAMWKGDERIYPFTIEVSSDGETWTTAHEKRKTPELRTKPSSTALKNLLRQDTSATTATALLLRVKITAIYLK